MKIYLKSSNAMDDTKEVVLEDTAIDEFKEIGDITVFYNTQNQGSKKVVFAVPTRNIFYIDNR